MVICLTLGAVGCGGGSEGDGSDEELQPVETDLEVPDDAPAIFALAGAVEAEVTASTFTRGEEGSEEISLTFGGVSSGECDNVNVRLNVPTSEGETGTFETIKTPQFTCKSTQYTASSSVRVTVETHADGQMAGAVAGTFDETSGGEAAEPALEVEGRFDIEYGE